MSNRPDNPFQQSPPGTMYGDQRPQQGSGAKVWLWILGTIAAIMVIGALVCCGGVFLAYRAGTGMIAEAVKTQLSANPVIVEHIGEIESLDMSLTKTGEFAESSGGAVAFNISGPKGSGTLLVKQAPGANGQDIESAELVMADGTRYPVPLASDVESMEEPASSEDFEIQLNEFNTEQPVGSESE